MPPAARSESTSGPRTTAAASVTHGLRRTSASAWWPRLTGITPDDVPEEEQQSYYDAVANQLLIWLKAVGIAKYCCYVDHQVVAAQFMLESGYGTSAAAKKKSNLGGIMSKGKPATYQNNTAFYDSYLKNIVKHWPKACGKWGEDYIKELQAPPMPLRYCQTPGVDYVHEVMEIYDKWGSE